MHLPADVAPYKRTPEFTQDTVPGALTRRHTTKAGVWACIHVLEGTLRYRVLEPVRREQVLTPGVHGIVEPEVPHEVEPMGAVRFYVEFSKREASQD